MFFVVVTIACDNNDRLIFRLLIGKVMGSRPKWTVPQGLTILLWVINKSLKAKKPINGIGRL